MGDQLLRDLELLAGLFKAGDWRELRIEADGVSVLFSHDPATGGLDDDATSLPAIAHADDRQRKAAPAAAIVAPMHAQAQPVVAAIDPAWRAVVAPNLGTFYRSPKPGSPPFVELGDRVASDTEICLLEVMKLFTSVKAGVAGVVRRIDAADAELVEGGQLLFHIEPE